MAAIEPMRQFMIHKVVDLPPLSTPWGPLDLSITNSVVTMFAGAAMTEVVFAWPGMGRLTFNAILQHDYPVVMAVFIVIGTSVVLANLLIDLAYGVLDPRIRYG